MSNFTLIKEKFQAQIKWMPDISWTKGVTFRGHFWRHLLDKSVHEISSFLVTFLGYFLGDISWHFLDEFLSTLSRNSDLNPMYNSGWKISTSVWFHILRYWANFSAIVYIAVWIHVMFDYMNQNLGFYPWKNPMLWFMFMLNIT